MRFQIARHLGRLKRESARARGAFRGAVNATALARAGFRAPTPDALPPEFSPTDYLHFLLYIDAEIEHGLMVQYLYAAYSLGGPQVPEEHRPMIQGWREVILGIAKEEMGHLLSVQNILRLTGGPLDFGRDDFPWTTPFYPFPFSLEPLTLRSLAAYVYAESPVDWSGPEADEVKKLVHEIASEPHQVSALFEEMIRLMKDPDFIPDEVFQTETWPYQANWDEWGRGYQGGRRGDSTGANPRGAPDVLVIPVASRDNAVASLSQIAEQGEDTSTADPSKLSHFARFLQIYHEMKKLEPVCQRDGWSPARNVASNPYIPEEDGSTPDHTESYGRQCDAITNPEARSWAHLFNVRYRMLLTYLSHSFELSAGEGASGPRCPRATVINATFGEMYNLRAIAGVLTQTPLADTPPAAAGKTAGPPFQMPYTLRRPMGEANRWRLHKQLVLASRALITELLRISPPPRHHYLHSLREADDALLGVIDHILRGYALTTL
jgi:hypothetical protein